MYDHELSKPQLEIYFINRNYEDGVVDVASLGFMQIDKERNVNPSMLPGVPGPGASQL